MYTIVSYILTYPAGLFLIDYMPTTDVVIETNSTTVLIDLLMGALIPSIFAVIFCGICALIGANLAKAIRKDNNSKNENKSEGHNFKVMDNFEKSNKNNRKRQRKNKNGKFMNPIEKSKIKNQNDEYYFND